MATVFAFLWGQNSPPWMYSACINGCLILAQVYIGHNKSGIKKLSRSVSYWVFSVLSQSCSLPQSLFSPVISSTPFTCVISLSCLHSPIILPSCRCGPFVSSVLFLAFLVRSIFLALFKINVFLFVLTSWLSSCVCTWVLLTRPRLHVTEAPLAVETPPKRLPLDFTLLNKLSLPCLHSNKFKRD